MSKKIILGLNSFTSTAKVSNSNWENSIIEPITLEQGDTIELKSSYIDTRNRVSGNIILDQDTTIELSYYFYYVNRGGTTIQSRVNDPNFPKRQQLVSEYFNYNDETTTMTNVQPTGVSFSVPVSNDSTGKVPEYLSPLAESIYHTYSSDKINNWLLSITPVNIPLNQVKKDSIYEIVNTNETPDSDFVRLGAPMPIYNTKVFKATENGDVIGPNPNPVIQFTDIAISTAYQINNIGLRFQGGYDTNWGAIGFNQYSYPTNKNFTSNTTAASTAFISVQNNITSINTGITYNILTTSEAIEWNLYGGPTRPTISSLTDMTINDTFQITNVGRVWDTDKLDTNWLSFSNTLNPVSIGQKFVCTSNTYTPYTFNDLTKFDTLNSFIITNSIGINFALMGGPYLPDSQQNPILKMNSQVEAGHWYRFTGAITPPFKDGTLIADYSAYCGLPAGVVPTIGTQFVATANSSQLPQNQVSNSQINYLNVGVELNVINAGLINWILLGYSPPNQNVSIDITETLINTYYRVVSTGATWGVNNQFLQSNLVGNTINNTIILTTPYTPTIYNFPILHLAQLNSSYNGECFILIDTGTGADNTWQNYFTIITTPSPGFSQGVVIKAKNLTNSMPPLDTSVSIQWFQLRSIPKGSSISVEAQNLEMALLFGALGGDDAVGQQTFTTTKNFLDIELSFLGFNGNGLDLQGSFSFIAPKNLVIIDNYQVPFTFTITNNPSDFNDTTYRAVILPTDEIQEITNYSEFPLPAFKPTTLLTNPLPYNSSFVADVVPTGEVLEDYNTPFTFTATANGSYSYYENKGIAVGDLTYTANVIPTGSVQAYYEIAVVQQIPDDSKTTNHILANNPCGFSNTQDINSPDGLPYLLCYSVPKNIDGSTNFDKSIMDPGDLVPFVKKWKMVLKAGSYSPDYLAEIISRGMSIQKTKLNRVSKITTTKNSFLGTPTQGVQSQMYKSIDLSYLRNYISGEGLNSTSTTPIIRYFGYSARDCQQGPFPNPNQLGADIRTITTFPRYTGFAMEGDPPFYNDPIDANRLDPSGGFAPYPPNQYQPNLFWNSKNKNIMPGYNGNYTTLPNKLPVNPKYSDLDFNDPDSDYQDDLPFVYRPNAFTHVDKNQTQGNVRLVFNDYNLSNYNDMPSFGTTSDTNTKCIEMMYRPLISDVDSSYYNHLQEKFGLPISKDYSIRPVISASVANIKSAPASMPAFELVEPAEQEGQVYVDPYPAVENAVGIGYSAPCDIATPVVGSPLMALSYNKENNGLFEFPYTHTPIYSKPLTTGTNIQESSAMYPSSVIISNQSGSPSEEVDITQTILANSPFIQTTATISGPNTTMGKTTYKNGVYKNVEYHELFSGDGITPIYLVWKGSLFGGVDGINDLTFTIVEFAPYYNPANLEEILGYYNNNLIVSGVAPTPKITSSSFSVSNSVIQIGSQSGIIFKDMKATKADGSSMPFWEQLGFDVKNITHKYDPTNPSSFMLDYETFTKSTTTAFQGTGTLFDPETLSSGTNELSYVSYVDSLNMLGWYVGSSVATKNTTAVGMIADGQDAGAGNTGISPINQPPFANDIRGAYNVIGFQGNFVLQNKILYSAVETTNSLAAKVVYSDFTETGHVLVCIEGYNGVLITQTDKLNVKSLVSTYYTGPNAFITNSSTDSAIYEHVGMPMKLQNFKIRILSPYTNKELVNLGSNSSIYLEITKTLTKNNQDNISFES